jgi:hypothetical protein
MYARVLKKSGFKIKYMCENIYIKIHKKKLKKSLPNRLSSAKTAAEDLAERVSITEDTVAIYKKLLPKLLKEFSYIKDPRNPSYIKHKMTTLFIYGLITAVFHIGSRRQANREISRGVFFENLLNVFPELETLPHADTLARFLTQIDDISQIQDCAIALIKELIKEKKFKDFLYKKRYLIAIDGTQKQIRNYKYSDKALYKNYKDGKKYYCYVVEAVLIFKNGLTLPLISEILENTPNENEVNDEKGSQTCLEIDDRNEEQIKQDCENKGFKRIAENIKKHFPSLPITLVLDGLYANGPIIQICKTNKWEFMINLKDKCLKDVHKEANALININPENRLLVQWGERMQIITWANDVEYEYKEKGSKRYKTVNLHVVICHESWIENHSNSTSEIEKKETRYVWLSSEPLDNENVSFRCTKIARARWKIENNILKEKKHGYEYEHFYSYGWNAMRGYHYLMHIGHLINELVAYSDLLSPKIAELGIRGFIKLFKLCLNGSKICSEKIKVARQRNYIFRLAS